MKTLFPPGIGKVFTDVCARSRIPSSALRRDRFDRPHHPRGTRGLLRVMLSGDTAYYVVAEAERDGWTTIERTLDGTVGSMVLMNAPAGADDGG